MIRKFQGEKKASAIGFQLLLIVYGRDSLAFASHDAYLILHYSLLALVYVNIRCHPFFLVVIFSSHCTINLCRNKSSFIFWKKNFNKVSDKLHGQLLVLLAAKLKTACTKLLYVARSL